MTRTIKTTNIKRGNASFNYAMVKDRLVVFRGDFPHSKIVTKNTLTETGGTEFQAYIWKDRNTYISGDLDSADSTGTSRGKVDGEKNFEKLETIAVGRALALLGYIVSGEIASYEEMEEYYRLKAEERKEYVQDQLALIKKCKTLDELREVWNQTNKSISEIKDAKDNRKLQLEEKEVKREAPKHRAAK